MDSKIKLDDEIETEEQRETFKQTLLRLLDDPQNSAEDRRFPTPFRSS